MSVLSIKRREWNGVVYISDRKYTLEHGTRFNVILWQLVLHHLELV